MTFKELIEVLKKEKAAYGIIEALPDDLNANIRVKHDSHHILIIEGWLFSHYLPKLNDLNWKLIAPCKTYYLTVKYQLPATDDLSSEKLCEFFTEKKATVINMTKQEINQ